MGSRKRTLSTIICLMMVVVTVSGCKKNKSKEAELVDVNSNPTVAATSTPTPTPTIEPTPTVDVTHEGMAKSKLTGEWVDEEIANKRPYAIMINNIINANPQSGIGEADIIYEALVEGGMTRMMAIFGNIDADTEAAKRIGSIRSARHYFVSFADEYDAIFVHFGQTTYATKKIKKLKINTVSAMDGPGVNSFYRDNSIKKPHNAFTDLEGLTNAVEKGKYRTTYEDNFEAHYNFFDEDTLLTGDSANKIKLKYSNVISPVLEYDETTKEYLRYQYDGPHIDYNTKKQLSFKNVIIQFVKEWDIDTHDYQTMDLEDASGEGYYITNGTMTKITWKKNESTKFMRYYDSEGKELTINPGKTFISIFPNDRVKDVVIE